MPFSHDGHSALVFNFGSDHHLHSILDRFDEAGIAQPLVSLTDALVRSPVAQRFPDLRVGIRGHPTPRMALLVDAHQDSELLLTQLPTLLHEAGTRFRAVSWSEVESAAEALAHKLHRTLPADFLAEARLLAIPRGGLFVAGLVAYALSIPRERIATVHDPVPPSEPAIIVDDVILTGLRLKGILHRNGFERFAIATLFAHPEMSRAVEGSEAGCVRCVSGAHLRDHGFALLGPEYGRWKEAWALRVPERYATFLTDLISFPWSEPDKRSWNEGKGRVDEGWWLAPPDLCFRSRTTNPVTEVQVADERAGIDRLASDVVPVDTGDSLVLIACERHEGVTLRGTGVELLEKWLAHGSEAAAGAVAEEYDVSPGRVRADLDGLLNQLRNKGMLADRA